jgi:hypothetical protein
MVNKRLITVLIMVLASSLGRAQVTSDLFIANRTTVKSARLHIETSALTYRNSLTQNNNAFGFGLGGELTVLQSEYSFLSLATTLMYAGANEELKTYSIENSEYYYRSTTLTGRLLISPALCYKVNWGKQLQLGIGFQPQILIKKFSNNYTLGTSNTTIPDIAFRKTEMTILTSLGYQIDDVYMVNLIGQFGVSPVTQGIEQPHVHAVRMQISKRIY